MPLYNTLFAQQTWHTWVRLFFAAAKKSVDEMKGDEFLAMSPETFTEALVDEFSVRIATLREEEITSEPSEEVIEAATYDSTRRTVISAVVGTVITVIIPFDGDSSCLQIIPTEPQRPTPQGVIKEGSIILTQKGAALDQEEVQLYFASTISKIKSNLDQMRRDAAAFNDTLRRDIRKHVDERRAKLLNDRKLASSLGFPLRQRTDAPLTYKPPEVRRKIRSKAAVDTSSSYEPEPELIADHYEHILSVIHSMTQVMERSPAAFQNMDEEALRVHYLVQLNGHYEGQATGETFNLGGKTDILVRSGDRNVFIAECKIWAGAQALTDSIDQLLSYLCWRDTKAAIVLFSKNVDFTNVLAQIDPTMKAHSNYLRAVQQSGETRFRYVFSHRNDPSREITITVLAFDVPRPKK
jgi:hypothetical protein